MKLITVLILATCLTASAAGFAQRITLSEKNARLEKIFKQLKKQTGYDFFYNMKTLQLAEPVSIKVKDASLTDVLDLCFKDQPLSYTITDKMVVVKVKYQDAEKIPEIKVPAPPIDVTGRITDEDGNGIAGVSVKVKGTSRGTSTNPEGFFVLKGVDERATLEISSAEFENQIVPVVTRKNVEVTLKRKSGALNEVVLKPYWKETKRMEVGNSVTVTAKDIEKQPVNNPLLALQGRVPGMAILQANGVPGGGITIRIQGRNNLNNLIVGSDPFIVIDGVPYASQNLSTFRGGGILPILGSSSNDGLNSQSLFGNPLAFINPADIESITVLKDADATAIYGSRAANGAILITTKKGRLGSMNVHVDLQQGWGKVAKKMKLLNSQQYMEMRLEAKRNDGRSTDVTDYDLRGVWDTTHYTDWQEELIGGTATFTRITAGVSAGTENFNYRLSSTYGRDGTVFPGDFANTFGSLQFTISASSANQRFRMQFGGSYMANNNKLPAEDYTNHSLNLPPVAPTLFKPDGSLNWAPDPVTGKSTWWNPLSRKYNLFEIKTNNLISHGSLSYRMLPGLELKSTFGFTSTTSDQFTAALDETEQPELRQSRSRRAIFSFNTIRGWIVEPRLNYQNKWGNHGLSALVGTTFQYQNNNGRAFTSRNHSSDLLLRDMLAGATLTANGVAVSEYKYNAIYGRIGYINSEKYILNASVRRDGSSRFGPESQFANFWSVGTGWILTGETFFQKFQPILSFAKVWASYGTTGSDQIGDFRFMSLYRSTVRTIQYQGMGSSEPIGLPNPHLEWEETKKFQGGFDLGFLKDRILLKLNYYRNRSSNTLISLKQPSITGFPDYITNLSALLQNTGWEFSLASTNVTSNNIRWNTSFNLTIPRSKVLEFPGLESFILANYVVVDKPLGLTRISPFYGVDATTGLFLVANRHGDPTNNPDVSLGPATDGTKLVNQSSPWYGGVQNSLSFKEFSIDFLIQFTKRNAFDNSLRFGTPGMMEAGSIIFGNQPVEVMDRWQKPGDNSKYERYSTGLAQANLNNYGDLFYRDVSFVRLKNLSISYEAHYLFRKLNLRDFRIYANAQNVITLTKYKGLDPETLSTSSLPPLRMITVGIRATF